MEQVKALREKTGAGVVEVKKALDEAAGDETKAIEILRKRGQAKAEKKGGREAREGVIAAYVHSDDHIAVLVKLYCETDFVARNEEFRELGRDIAIHIAAAAPEYVKPEDVPETVLEQERGLWREQLANEGKPAEMIDKIISGKEEKFRGDISLLTQAYVKDPSKTVGELITEKIHKIGENINVGSFVRYEM